MRPRNAVDYSYQDMKPHDCECQPCMEMLQRDRNLDDRSLEIDYVEAIDRLYDASNELESCTKELQELKQTLKNKDEQIKALEQGLKVGIH
jgi:chromosome segregation ATPase